MLSKNEFEKDLEVISKNSDKNEKLAWVRKKKKMDELIHQLTPIEDEILKLITQKQPILDEIANLRKIMVKQCIHSDEYLVHYGKYVECKFCDTKISINKTFI